MNKEKPYGVSRQKGISLIEALVALVILAIGSLSIAKLNAYLVEVGGLGKARAQATALAEGKLEELRNLMVKKQFEDIASPSGAETIYGYSAGSTQSTAFTRNWITGSGENGRKIEVTVAWTDRLGATQQVVVRSEIAWDDPARAAAWIRSVNLQPNIHAKSPTGRARLGEGTVPVDGNVQPNADGLREQQGSDDGRWRLVQSNGTVLLTALNPNEAFSKISGNVYIDQTQLQSLTKPYVHVVISDASYCSMIAGSNDSLIPLGSGSAYKYFSYICYVGANWYGNIAVVRTDSPVNANNRICLGDPIVAEVSYESDSDSQHPVLASVRGYRGYQGTTSFVSTGIGINSTGAYTAATYNGHDFLLTRITGNPSNSSCNERLTLYSSSNPNVPFGTDSTIATPPTATASAVSSPPHLGNPGKFFCLSESCPSPLPVVGAADITISVTGTITRYFTSANNSPSVTSMTIDGGTCSYSAANVNSYTYACTVILAGWTGLTWSGNLTVNTDGVLCSSDWTSVGTGGYTFAFNEQSLDQTTYTKDFIIDEASGDCVP